MSECFSQSGRRKQFCGGRGISYLSGHAPSVLRWGSPQTWNFFVTCVWHGWTSIIVWYQGWVYGNAEADKSQPKPALVTLQREVVENVEDKADNLVVGNVGKHFPKPASLQPASLQLRLLLSNQPFKGVPTWALTSYGQGSFLSIKARCWAYLPTQ